MCVLSILSDGKCYIYTVQYHQLKSNIDYNSPTLYIKDILTEREKKKRETNAKLNKV